MKVKPDPICSGFGTREGVLDASQTTNLHADDGVRHATGLHKRDNVEDGRAEACQPDSSATGTQLKKLRSSGAAFP